MPASSHASGFGVTVERSVGEVSADSNRGLFCLTARFNPSRFQVLESPPIPRQYPAEGSRPRMKEESMKRGILIVALSLVLIPQTASAQIGPGAFMVSGKLNWVTAT